MDIASSQNNTCADNNSSSLTYFNSSSELLPSESSAISTNDMVSYVINANDHLNNAINNEMNKLIDLIGNKAYEDNGIGHIHLNQQ